MLLCGLWHGAGWTFVCWGGLHGFYLMAAYLIRKRSGLRKENEKILSGKVSLIGRWFTTQILVCFAWIVFRAPNLKTVGIYLAGLIGSGGNEGIHIPFVVWLCFLATLVDHLYGWLVEHRSELFENIPDIVTGVGYALMIVFLYHATPHTSDPFIYFQF